MKDQFMFRTAFRSFCISLIISGLGNLMFNEGHINFATALLIALGTSVVVTIIKHAEHV